MSERLRQALPVVAGFVLFLVALEVLRVELRGVRWHDLVADVIRTPPSRLGFAVVLTALNYAALTGYDLLAFAYIGKILPRAPIALASFVAVAGILLGSVAGLHGALRVQPLVSEAR